MNGQNPATWLSVSNNPDSWVFTRRQFATTYDLSLRTVDKLIASGQLKVLRFGRSVRIPKSAADKLLSGSADQPQQLAVAGE